MNKFFFEIIQKTITPITIEAQCLEEAEDLISQGGADEGDKFYDIEYRLIKAEDV